MHFKLSALASFFAFGPLSMTFYRDRCYRSAGLSMNGMSPIESERQARMCERWSTFRARKNRTHACYDGKCRVLYTQVKSLEVKNASCCSEMLIFRRCGLQRRRRPTRTSSLSSLHGQELHVADMRIRRIRISAHAPGFCRSDLAYLPSRRFLL